MNLQEAQQSTLEEYTKASNSHKPFTSKHEGFAILLEEVDELWHEVKHGGKKKMKEEAIQVAAMAMRFLVDCCDNDKNSKRTDYTGLTNIGNK